MAIPPSGKPAAPTMAHSASAEDVLNSATPHSSTVVPTPARRRAHPAPSSSRVLQHHYPPKDIDTPVEEPSTPIVHSGLAVRAPIVIRPSGRPGFNAPKAATFFLGKDHERWRQYDRERFSGIFSWERVASAISAHSHRGSRGAFSSYSSGSDDDHSDSGTSYRSSRSRSSRYSAGSRSRRPSDAFTPPMTPFDLTQPSSRPRRFSSNGHEAAFQRHETVIGIHTPRRRSSASSDALPFLRPLAQIHPASGHPSSVDVADPASKPVDAKDDTQQKPKKVKHSNEERPSKKKDKTSIAKSHAPKPKVKDAPIPNKAGPHAMLDLDEAARPHLRRLRSNLQEAAAAAAASTEASPAIQEAEESLHDAVGMHVSLSDAALEGKGPLSAQDLRSLLPTDRTSSTFLSPLSRGASPRAPPLKLAKRLQPQTVEGTLYDKTGPYREGAVSDGLSVRLFSAEAEPRTSSFEDADLSNSEHPVTKPWGRRGSGSSFDHDDDDAVFMQTTRRRSNSSGGDNRRLSPQASFTDAGDAPSGSAVDDGSNSSQVYLITTPDNRVSSAAKLRRWAMDSAGNFYAAMEIKSIEAKLRAADPSAGKVSRELAQELEETYLDDILDEVQKAQTLNPTRSGAVSKILKTEDDRYVRLEEDYPEEAFFVIAGCEEAELNGVILNVFVQAIRTLSRFHASGWMHGDVKLENLMFDENGELVVIDYENANPYRGIPGGDGQVQLVSYDWIPPEACPGPMGRRMGPSGDLWALGCNLIRAYALRDGVEDASIRETLLGKGQKAFLDKMSKLVSRKSRDTAGSVPADDYFAAKSVDGSEVSAGVAGMPWDIFAYHVDLEPILNDTVVEDEPLSSCPHGGTRQTQPAWATTTASSDASGPNTDEGSSSCCNSCINAATPDSSFAASSGRTSPRLEQSTLSLALPTPARLLYRFARSAPELLTWVLSRCVVESIEQRNIAEAEAEGLQLAEWVEEHKAELMQVGKQAVDAAIELSGSVWVRPRLDDARKSLGLD
ncbi:hypothetical protein EX895_005983 [Sporisorium graminicola]|uniref:non-specific serine/threonine protein kinase n=1 Tax=Sporisorium graminicola TaxID=280036 RepID=A0A4U7KLP1_9BASI|nr:hypothetical protein EX895_005983 [Sporisorium graminicola]TKY84903.1 hypothetical protein EX895_005983 [Sporisorium graminicola]